MNVISVVDVNIVTSVMITNVISVIVTLFDVDIIISIVSCSINNIGINWCISSCVFIGRLLLEEFFSNHTCIYRKPFVGYILYGIVLYSSTYKALLSA